MCVYICVHMPVCLSLFFCVLCTSVCVPCVYLCVCVYPCLFLNVCFRVCMCLYICVYHVSMFVCVCAPIYL
jgi:hypothetical protein